MGAEGAIAALGSTKALTMAHGRTPSYAPSGRRVCADLVVSIVISGLGQTGCETAHSRATAWCVSQMPGCSRGAVARISPVACGTGRRRQLGVKQAAVGSTSRLESCGLWNFGHVSDPLASGRAAGAGSRAAAQVRADHIPRRLSCCTKILPGPLNEGLSSSILIDGAVPLYDA